MEVAMGEVVGFPTSPKDDVEFVSDMARYGEGLLDEKAIKRKYYFDDATWEALGSDDELVRAIEREKIRRVRTGQQKRERAQTLVTQAPDVLSGILLDNSASARHRIDSAKTLNDFAANPSESTPTSDSRFIITINLSADGAEGEQTILHFDKSRKPDVNDGDVHHIDDMPQDEWLPTIATKKPQGDDDGQPL
jgi:hypothetical protein